MEIGKCMGEPVCKGAFSEDYYDAWMYVLLRDKMLLEHFGRRVDSFLLEFFDHHLDESLYKMYNSCGRSLYAVERLFKTGESMCWGFENYKFEDVNLLYRCMLRDCGYLPDFSFDVPQIISYKGTEYVLPGLNQFTFDRAETVNGTPVFWGVHYEDSFNVGYGSCFGPKGDVLCRFGHFERPVVANVDGYEFLINRRDSSHDEYYKEPFIFINEHGETFLTDVERYLLPEHNVEPNKGISVFHKGHQLYINGLQLKNISEKTMIINDDGILQKVDVVKSYKEARREAVRQRLDKYNKAEQKALSKKQDQGKKSNGPKLH